MKAHDVIPLDAINAARKRIEKLAMRTPLIKLNVDHAPAEIYLKCENLQPIGSFKLRGAGNAMSMATKEQLAQGVFTASAGNMAQGVAYAAQKIGVKCTVVVPANAPEMKLAAIDRLGGEIIKVPYSEWWNIMITHKYPPLEEKLFLHPSSNPNVMAGNATIGLEILEDLSDVDTILIPWGSGGLSCGIASAVRAIKPDTRIFACEAETGAPVAASFKADAPQEVTYQPSFVDGIGSRSVLVEMWPLARKVLDGSLVTTLAEIASAIRLLIERNRMVAEGAGAAPVAIALSGHAGKGKVACVVSGGNLNTNVLARILSGEEP